MIKAIIFDAGDVYLKGDFKGFIKRGCEILCVDYEQYMESHKKHSISRDLHRGTMSFEDALEEFFQIKISKEDMKKLKTLWLCSWKIDGRMVELTKRIKRNYKIALLTNSDPLYAELSKKEGWYKHFDAVVYSSDLGIVKPDPEIFRHTAKLLGVRPEECVFVDDLEDYIVGAKEIGMKTIHFKSYCQLVSELKKNIIFDNVK